MELLGDPKINKSTGPRRVNATIYVFTDADGSPSLTNLLSRCWMTPSSRLNGAACNMLNSSRLTERTS